MIFLDAARVVQIHRALCARFGGPPGVRDQGLLISALAQPRQTFLGRYLHEGLFDMAAAYAYHLALDRPFVFANRRTAAAAAGVFLLLNGYRLACDPHVLFRAIVSTGEGLMSKVTLARFLEMNSDPADSL